MLAIIYEETFDIQDFQSDDREQTSSLLGPVRYKVCSPFDGVLRGFPKFVEFQPDNENLPIPSPYYLAMHAACARVANLSGASEYIDRVQRDMEDIWVLSEDGSSADILEYAISCHQISVY